MSANECPHCRTANSPQARFCSRCGKTLPVVQPQAAPPAQVPASPPPVGRPPAGPPYAPPSPPPAAALSNCPQCRVPVRAGDRFCPTCGYTLNKPGPAGGTMVMALPGAGPIAGVQPGGTVMMGALGGPPSLVIRWMGGNSESHLLSGQSARVGRAPDNDIVVNHPSVSGHHLCLENRGGTWTVTDLKSTNGTQLNGQLIPPNEARPLQSGSVIRIGDLTGNSVSMSIETGEADSLRTLALGKLDLSNLTQVVIGRDPNSYLPLNHPTVSTRHAMILKQDGALLIRDLGSTNGTFVNGNRISQVPLASGDVIQIGPFKLVYDAQQQSLAQSMRLGHRLDAIQLGREVANKRMILKDVTMPIEPGDFVALVGGSGAGKSTLMKAMNGYEPGNHGQMLLDGEPFYPKLDLYRTQMGYVPQDDIIHRELPVRLALWYAARLRLPDASPAEVEARIADALRVVEMTEHADKPVRVLSGGQRKRVSIAVELLAKPALFFLDEPTSGLDPGLEKKMMYDLNRLADEGRTVVLVTHATANIEQCDYVAFMSYGKLAFYGPPKDAIKFFGAQDFADIYLRLQQTVDASQGKPPPVELQPYYQAVAAGQGGSKVPAGHLWAEHFRQSPYYQQHIASRQRSLGGGAAYSVAGGAAGPVRRPRDSFLRQTYLLARRQLDLIRLDLRTLLVLLVMMPFIGFLFMLVSGEYDIVGRRPEAAETIKADLIVQAEDEYAAYADEYDEEDEERDWLADYTPYATAKMLLVMIGLALTQGGTFGAAYEIVKERAIFKRERAVNLSVVAYVLSKFAVLSLFAVFQVAAVVFIIWLRVDLNYPSIMFPDYEWGGALEIFIILFLGVLASIGFGLFLSAIVPTTDVVLYAILAQLFVQIILSGTLFPLPSNPVSMATPGYWTMNALASSVDLPQLDKDGISCKLSEVPSQAGGTTTRVDCSAAAAREESLKNYDHSEEHLQTSWIVLVVHSIIWLLLTIVVQARKKID